MFKDFQELELQVVYEVTISAPKPMPTHLRTGHDGISVSDVTLALDQSLGTKGNCLGVAVNGCGGPGTDAWRLLGRPSTGRAGPKGDPCTMRGGPGSPGYGYMCVFFLNLLSDGLLLSRFTITCIL